MQFYPCLNLSRGECKMYSSIQEKRRKNYTNFWINSHEIESIKEKKTRHFYEASQAFVNFISLSHLAIC